MTSLSPHEKTKDKKKSIVGRLFSFGHQTGKDVKKSDSHSSKNKSKSSSMSKLKDSKSKSSKGLTLSVQDEIQTCTYCDYCDKEIIVDFTGQSIICHESCKKTTAKLTCTIAPDLQHLRSVKPPAYSSDTYIIERFEPRASLNHNDVRIHGRPPVNDVTLKMRSHPYVDSSYGDFFSDMETGSYTFSTVDLSSIRQHDISIKKVALTQGYIDHNIAALSIGVSDRRKGRTGHRNSENCESVSNYDWRSVMDVFNDNEQGLIVEPHGADIMGKVRVFINLLRPIKMLLTAPQERHLDFFVDTTINCRRGGDQEEIFWLSRGTTTLLYVSINYPTSEVIALLLSKFNIKNNPKKFALYEHCIKSPKEVEVCKLRPSQCPLKIMMEWCTQGVEHYHRNLETRKFVLQENDPGSIEWEEFSVPELRSFVKILGQEEEEKGAQIIRKYDILRSEIGRRMALKAKIRQETESVYL